jgi:hypothetical protein
LEIEVPHNTSKYTRPIVTYALPLNAEYENDYSLTLSLDKMNPGAFSIFEVEFRTNGDNTSPGGTFNGVYFYFRNLGGVSPTANLVYRHYTNSTQVIYNDIVGYDLGAYIDAVTYQFKADLTLRVFKKDDGAWAVSLNGIEAPFNADLSAFMDTIEATKDSEAAVQLFGVTYFQAPQNTTGEDITTKYTIKKINGKRIVNEYPEITTNPAPERPAEANITANSILFGWAAPAYAGVDSYSFAFDGYSIEVTDADGNKIMDDVKVAGKNTTSYLFEGLNADTAYYFSLKAVSGAESDAPVTLVQYAVRMVRTGKAAAGGEEEGGDSTPTAPAGKSTANCESCNAAFLLNGYGGYLAAALAVFAAATLIGMGKRKNGGNK